MSSLSRKTYDTDVITLRRVFAYNPEGNAPISTGAILAVTGSRGTASFIDPFELSSFRTLSTSVGAGTFKSISSANATFSSIAFIDSATDVLHLLGVSSGILYLNQSSVMGSEVVTTSQLTSTILGLGSAGYISTFSTSQLSTGILKSGDINTSTLNLIDSANGGLRTVCSSNDFLYYNGNIVSVASITSNISSYIYQVSSVSTIYAYTIPVTISSATNVFINTNFFSSFSFSTSQLITSSANLIDLTNGTQQLLAVSSGQLLLNSAAIVADLTKENLFSTVAGIGTIGYISSSQLVSTTSGLVSDLFPPYFASTVEGLAEAGYISSAQLLSTTAGLVKNGELVSTVLGLGSSGYISSTQLLSTTAGVVKNGELLSTFAGLGTAGYISSAHLTSTTAGVYTILLANVLTSTVTGLGAAGYLSTAQLTSTTAGIFGTSLTPFINHLTSPFVSTASLTSTLSNLYIPAGPSTGIFQLFAASDPPMLHFGFRDTTASQIFVGDWHRTAPVIPGTNPLIKVSQDVLTDPRPADVLNILGGVNNSKMIKIDSNLNLGVGISQSSYNNSSALSYALQVAGNSLITGSAEINNFLATSTLILTDMTNFQFSTFGPTTSNIRLALASGDAYKPTGSTWKTLSDARIKENIVLADYNRCYEDLKKIPLRRYKYTSSFVEQAGVLDKTVLGFVAQELLQVMPKSVTQQPMYGFDDLNTISIDQINMASIGALKKTIADKEALESTTQGLIKQNEGLQTQIVGLNLYLSNIHDDFRQRISTLENKMIDIKNDLSMSHSIL